MPASNSIRKINKKISTLQLRKVLVFLVFVLISAFFWCLYNLSKQREAEFSLPVGYRHIPEYIVTTGLPNKINISVKDMGINLFLSGWKMVKDTVYIDLKNKFEDGKNNFSISQRELRQEITKNIRKTSVIQKITPENIEADFTLLYQKKMPVHLSDSLRFAKQYVLKEKMSITPDSVTVFAPLATLQTTNAVYAILPDLSRLKESTVLEVNLQPIKDARFTARKVQLNIPIEQATEKILEVPVTGVNFPVNAQLRTFPAQVKVSLWVGLSRFEAIEPNDFAVYLDYQKLSHSDSRQKLQYSTSLTDVYNIKLIPEEVEYIMEEKLLAP